MIGSKITFFNTKGNLETTFILTTLWHCFNKKLPKKCILRSLSLWSCGGSNPGPNKEPTGFLHVYPSLILVPKQVKGNQPEPYPLNFITKTGEQVVTSPSDLKPRFGVPMRETLRETTRSTAPRRRNEA